MGFPRPVEEHVFFMCTYLPSSIYSGWCSGKFVLSWEVRHESCCQEARRSLQPRSAS